MTTLGELAQSGVLELGDGYRTKQSELRESGFRIIRVADVKDGRIALDSPDFVSSDFSRQIGTKRAVSGDVLLTTKGTIGRVAIVPDLSSEAVYSPQLCWFRVVKNDVISRRYLAYWLQAPAFLEQSSYLQGNTDMAPYISLTDLRGTRIKLPPLPEQQSIAEVLGALDDKIAANTALAAAAESMSLAHLVGIDARVPLSELATLLKAQVNPMSGTPQVLAHHSLPAFDAGMLPSMDSSQDIKSNKFIFNEPVVLLSKLNPRFPRIWRADPDAHHESVASTEFLVLRPEGVSRNLLWAAISQADYSSELDSKVAGTSGSHQRVKPSDALAGPVRDVRGVSPVLAASIDTALVIASNARLESRALATTRDALLPQLMTGKLRVRDAEALASAAGA